MSSSKRGCCLLVVNINYTDGRGSSNHTQVLENSARVLRDTFRRLGFDVTELRNLSAKQLMDEADRIARMDHSALNCLAVILLTDAGKRDSLHCSDGVDVSLDDVRERFAASRCPSLAGKPKLFYRPWGRGFSRQGGVTTTDEGGKTQHVSNHADFVVLESCPPECMTANDVNTNVLRHVQLLAAVLERHSHDHDFLSCVTMANNEHSNYRAQSGSYITAPVYNSLTKSLKFPKPQ